MNSSLLLTLTIISLAFAIRWRGYDDDGDKVVRILRIIRQPPNFPNIYELRGVEREARGRRRVTDAVDFLFSVNVLPHFTVRHYERDSDGSEKRAARHGLRKLVEYIERGAADSGFSPDEDDIVQSYYFWQKTWTSLSVTPETLNGAAVTKVCSKTTDNVVEICAYFTDISSLLTVNGSSSMLDNNAIHHTLTVNRFPFASNASQLALKVHYESRTVVRDLSIGEVSNTEGAVELVDETPDSTIRPVASWAKTVTITGSGCRASGNVVRDVFRDVESSRDLDVSTPTIAVETSVTLKAHITYFSFLTGCQPDYLFWDPDIGIQDESSAMSLASSLLLLFSALYAVLM